MKSIFSPRSQTKPVSIRNILNSSPINMKKKFNKKNQVKSQL